MIDTLNNWQRVQQVFDRVVAAPAGERAAVLKHACGGDATLRAEVESLLEHDSHAGADFLASPVLALRSEEDGSVGPVLGRRGDWPTSSEERVGGKVAHEADDVAHGGATLQPAWAQKLVGRKIGRYKVERLIGHGGMGCVFEARQEQPARAVALKVLQPGFSAPSALARFRLEPEVLGRLQHPHIAQVFEAGLHEDELGAVPYFAMEFIPNAQPLLRYADAHGLTTRQRLELFAEVCDAVHHGHQKGIIHRDLKPANILVGADGEPKVIDFGVARASDADILLTTQYTHPGDLVGTVHYMSPEQCDGDSAAIDTRSDVYSLGVVLYEMLTGAVPYDMAGTTVYAAICVIKDKAPRPPGDVKRELRGDTDAILLKALEKDPARRYGSAADLAQDVRRHLAGEPIEARPPGRLTRIERWAVRNLLKVSACAGAAIIVLAVAGAATATWFFNFRPHRAVRSDNGEEIRLMSIGGRELAAWRSERPAFSKPIMVSRAPALGGGPLLLFGSQPVDGNPCPAGLLAFDVNRDVKKPCWVGRIKQNDIPPELTEREDYPFGPEDFSARQLLAADVFPEYPVGMQDVPEIVAVYYQRSTTHGAIRIHALDGTVLYQTWIDAVFDEPVWSPRSRLLAFSGLNGEAFLEDRNMRGAPGGLSHPLVVFAISPQLWWRDNKYIAQEEDQRLSAEGPLRCAWYYCVLTPNGMPLERLPLYEARPDSGVVSVPFELGHTGCSLFWNVAADGTTEGPFPSDHYKRNQTLPDGDPNKLPPPESFKLGPLPPIVSDAP